MRHEHDYRWWDVVGGIAFLLSPFIVAAVASKSSTAAIVVACTIGGTWLAVAAFGAGRAVR